MHFLIHPVIGIVTGFKTWKVENKVTICCVGVQTLTPVSSLSKEQPLGLFGSVCDHSTSVMLNPTWMFLWAATEDQCRRMCHIRVQQERHGNGGTYCS